jgi:hypothetical protein
MALQLWSPKDLLARLRDDRMDSVPSWFRDKFFGKVHYSSDRDILISELPSAGRKLAPFVLPTEQGKPMVEYKGETMKALTPPYMKPKDTVRIADCRNAVPGEVLGQPMTLQQRYNWRVGQVQDQHVKGIRTHEAYMCARAFIDSQLVIRYQNDQGATFPEVTISFGRAGNQTITLAGPTYWDDSDYPIMDDVQTWSDRMAAAKYGAYPKNMLVGASVAKVFRKNNQIKAEMDQTVRGNDVNVRTGIIRGPTLDLPIVYLGTIGNGIDVWAYRDYVENADGTLVDILDPRDVVLYADGAEGVMAYGAIYNDKAVDGVAQTDIFPTSWKIDDPSATVIMHESSPLPVMIYPNRTLKARVLL